MKKTIQGIAYDTDRAIIIGTVTGNEDTDWWTKETLYRTVQSRRYFLHGQGGPASPYATPGPGAAWESGERIRPLDSTAAKTWTEANLGMDAAAREWKPIDPDAFENLTVRIHAPAKHWLDEYRHDHDCTYSQAVERLILEAAGHGLMEDPATDTTADDGESEKLDTADQ